MTGQVWQFEGLKKGMIDSGAIFDKVDGDAVYFTIPKTSKLATAETIQGVGWIWKELLGLKLFVRYGN